MIQKKCISPVVATALLLVVAVTAVVGFQSWFQNFESNILANTQKQSLTDSNLKIEKVIGNTLYLKSSGTDTISLLKIINKDGNEMCEFSGSTNISNEGLVGWWTFDEIINDSGTLILPDYSGLGNEGILYDANITNSDGNTPPQLVKSKLGNALEFDGIDDYVDINNSISFTFTPYENFSIIIFYEDSKLKPDGEIISKFTGGSGLGYEIGGTGSIFAKHFYFGHNWPNDKLAGTFNNSNKYSNLIMVYDGTNNINAFKIYDNMQLKNIKSFGNDSISLQTTNTGNLNFGRRVAGYSFFQGQIDEIRIYNRTLSENEIKQLYYYSIQSTLGGINQIDISSCNLQKGQEYNILTFTQNSKAESTIIKN